MLLDVTIASIFPGVADISSPAAHSLSLDRARLSLRAANEAYEKKMTKYNDIALENNYRFMPLAFESSGSMHPQTRQFINTVAKHASNVKKIPENILLNYMLKVISANIQKSIAKSIVARSLQINNRTSSAFLTDDYVLSFEDQGF